MPAKSKDDDEPVTGVQAFAEELRAQRESAGLTQAQLVLRQRVGDAMVMREQFGRLVEAAENPKITIQVMPFTADAHPGLLGSFVVASFDDGPDAAYLDSVLDGQVSEQRKQIAQARLFYDTLAREALSPGASIKLIKKVIQEWT